MALFQKAEKRKAWLKLGLTGPSGAGKTYSALILASAMGEGIEGWKIAVIDTENASASLYADRFKFDTVCINAPYTIQKYCEAIDASVTEKYDVLIVDSLSHAWAGEGGLLAKKEAMDARGGNSYVNWAKITPEHEKFKAKILNSQIHMICTMRSKQDYVLMENEKGKQAPKKVGLAPIQREGMEYELTTVFEVGMDHQASVSKDRTGLFDGEILTIGVDHGRRLISWLNAGSGDLVRAAPKVAANPTQAPSTLTQKDLSRLYATADEAHWTNEEVKEYMAKVYKVDSSKKLTPIQIIELCKHIYANPVKETEL